MYIPDPTQLIIVQDTGHSVTHTLTVFFVSSHTSSSFSVPRRCRLGLPRMDSKAKARGLLSRFTDGLYPTRVSAIKLSPSSRRWESGRESAPRYNRRCAFGFAFCERDGVEAEVGRACLAGDCIIQVGLYPVKYAPRASTRKG